MQMLGFIVRFRVFIGFRSHTVKCVRVNAVRHLRRIGGSHQKRISLNVIAPASQAESDRSSFRGRQTEICLYSPDKV